MTTKRRRLPLAVENAVGQTEVLRHSLSEDFHRRVQDEVPKAGFRVTCSTGCSSCCYHPITISILEGILIYRWLLNHGKWTLALRTKLKETSDQQFGSSYEVWLLALIPCPLLDEKGKCGAYPSRPLICRAYFSLSDPYYCHPHRLGAETHIIPRDPVVEPFHAKQEQLLHKERLQMTAVPIGTALLLAERVCNGSIELSEVDNLLLKEYGDK